MVEYQTPTLCFTYVVGILVEEKLHEFIMFALEPDLARNVII